MSERDRTRGVFDRYSVVVTGTDPENPRGGIGYAMSGYIAALRAAGVEFQVRPTYHPHSTAGKFRPWVTEMLRLRRSIRKIRSEGYMPLFYAHAGGWPSLARELTLLKYASRLGARTMIQLHSTSLEELLASPTGGPLLRRRLRRCDVVCVLSAYWKRLLNKHGVENTAVVPNPLPPDLVERLERDEESPPVDAPRRILSMSRLIPGK